MDDHSRPGEITQLLSAARDGDTQAEEKLVRLIYEALRALARRRLRRFRQGHTWQPSELLHEALIKLDIEKLINRAQSRGYILAAASRAMNWLLLDHERRRKARIHGGHRRRVPLDDNWWARLERDDIEPKALHDALVELEKLSLRQCRAVQFRFYWALPVKEIAVLLGVSDKTIERDLRIARAWLRARLKDSF